MCLQRFNRQFHCLVSTETTGSISLGDMEWRTASERKGRNDLLSPRPARLRWLWRFFGWCGFRRWNRWAISASHHVRIILSPSGIPLDTVFQVRSVQELAPDQPFTS